MLLILILKTILLPEIIIYETLKSDDNKIIKVDNEKLIKNSKKSKG